MGTKRETPLRRAVDHLKKEGRINTDGELAQLLGFKSTGNISAYINGRYSKNFMKKFQETFKINVEEFAEDEQKNPRSQRDPKDQEVIDLLNQMVSDRDKIIFDLQDRLKERGELTELIKSNFAVLTRNQYKLAAIARVAVNVVARIESRAEGKSFRDVQQKLNKEILDHLRAMEAKGSVLDGGNSDKS